MTWLILNVQFVHTWGNHELYNFSVKELQSRPLFRDAMRACTYFSFAPAPGWRVLVCDSYDVAVLGRPEV